MCNKIIVKPFPAFAKYKVEQIEKMTLQWIERYNGEVADFNGKIKVTTDCIADVQLKYMEIRTKYDARQLVINEYREEQKILAEKCEYEAKQCRMAIQLQVKLTF